MHGVRLNVVAITLLQIQTSQGRPRFYVRLCQKKCSVSFDSNSTASQTVLSVSVPAGYARP